MENIYKETIQRLSVEQSQMRRLRNELDRDALQQEKSRLDDEIKNNRHKLRALNLLVRHGSGDQCLSRPTHE